MRPVEFPEQTLVIANPHPPHDHLPAYRAGPDTLSCWQLSWRDRFAALLGRPLWLWQTNFGRPLHPQQPSFVCPWTSAQRFANAATQFHAERVPHSEPYATEMDFRSGLF